MKITINGTPGSGKTTLGKDLAEHYDLDFMSVGDMRREMAREHDMTLAELNELGEEEEWTDKELDKRVKKYGEENDDFVVEGRLAWHFIPDSIKIFLDAEEEERAERMVSRDRPEESYEEVEEVIHANKERIKSDLKRYEKYYGVNPYEKENFDIQIDSTDKNPEEVLEETVEKIERLDHKL